MLLKKARRDFPHLENRADFLFFQLVNRQIPEFRLAVHGKNAHFNLRFGPDAVLQKQRVVDINLQLALHGQYPEGKPVRCRPFPPRSR